MTFFSSHSNPSNQWFKSFSQKPIPRIQNIQNLALILRGENFNLETFQPDNLRQCNIINHQFSIKKVFHKQPSIQIDFEPDLTLIALPKSLILRESIVKSPLTSLQSIELLQNYIDHFPQVQYHAFTVNFQQIFNLPHQHTFVKNYVQNTLLSPLSYQVMSRELSQMSLQLNYQLETGQLSLFVKGGNWQHSATSQPPFLSFVGSFTEKVASFYPQERVKKLQNALENISQHYQLFRHLIDQQFLG